MSQTALQQQEVVIRDISREPRVSRKGAPKKMTHTVALIPPNYVKILWHEEKDYLGPAIARSRGHHGIRDVSIEEDDGNPVPRRQEFQFLGLGDAGEVQRLGKRQ